MRTGHGPSGRPRCDTEHEGVTGLHELIERYVPFLLPVCVLSLWLAVATVTSLLSGWYTLMTRFPDRAEQPLLCIRRQSGRMRFWCSMNSILTLSVCPGGLRVGMMRLFGPFSRDFFVPWHELNVNRRTIAIWPVADLTFGDPVVGTLCVSADLANRLARGSAGLWPEAGGFPNADRRAIFRGLLAQWGVMSGLVPRIVRPRNMV